MQPRPHAPSHARTHAHTHTRTQASTQAFRGRQAGMQASRHGRPNLGREGRQAGRYTGRQASRQPGRQVDACAGTHALTNAGRLKRSMPTWRMTCYFCAMYPLWEPLRACAWGVLLFTMFCVSGFSYRCRGKSVRRTCLESVCARPTNVIQVLVIVYGYSCMCVSTGKNCLS